MVNDLFFVFKPRINLEIKERLDVERFLKKIEKRFIFCKSHFKSLIYYPILTGRIFVSAGE